MMTKQDHIPVREQAIALRLAGKSIREIKEALGPVSNERLTEALRGTPPPAWTLRPKAKDDLRDQARECGRGEPGRSHPARQHPRECGC
jgi:hypothetical protein